MKQFNLNEYLKDPSKKVITRDGRAVKIHCTNFNSVQPIIAEIEGAPSSDSFNKEGKFYQLSDTKNDLFFAPEKHEGWINISKGIFNDNRLLGHTRIFKTKENAEEAGEGVSGYIKTIKIEWEEE